MDQLIALVFLRLRLNLRALTRARERLLGLLILVPSYAALSVLGSVAVYGSLRFGEERTPDTVLPVLAGLVTLAGLAWATSPLLAGISFVEAHDIGRLLVFPVGLRVLVLSSFLANLLQPAALASLPLVGAFALGIGRSPLGAAGALCGGALSLGLVVAGAEVTSLLLHRVARDRRLQDLALFLGLGLGFLISLVPIALLGGPGRTIGRLVSGLLRSGVFRLSPFAWGVEAGVHAARGEWGGFLLFAGLGGFALLGTFSLSATIVRVIARGDLDVGPGPRLRSRGGRGALFPGALGALLEKDLRLSWREPSLRVLLVGSLLGPLILLFFLGRESAGPGAGHLVLALSSFVGLSNLGTNAFGFERRGIALLFTFPVERWKIVLGKNLGALAFRMPGLLVLLVAELTMAPLLYLPAALTIALSTFVLCVGLDNYVSILFPVAAPRPGANPYGGAGGGARGLGALVLSVLLLGVSLLLSSPFAFLCWLPDLLGAPALWLATVPLALGGAVSVYALLLAGASRLLAQREPDVLERILGEW